MAENTEAKLLENLDVLIGAIAGLGARYSPPNADASPANLQAKRAAGQAAVDALDVAEAAEAAARDLRQTTFADLSSLGSDLVKYSQALGYEENTVDELRSKVRELRGTRSAPKPTDDLLTPGVDESKNVGSAAQTSFASREATFSEMIAFLGEQGFAATEDGFKTADLKAKRDAMRAANTDVASAEGATGDARQTRDTVFYTGAANIVDSATAARNYLKAVFGDSQTWQSVKNLQFRLPRKLQ